MENKQITVTISEYTNYYKFKIVGKSPLHVAKKNIFDTMVRISDEYCNQGYAVLFEIE